MKKTRVVVIASRNPDKIREIRQLCEGLPFEIRGAGDYPGLPDVIEDGTTILGNAARKALATAAYTGEIAIADDTALRVDALDGLPGVFAARFAEPEVGGRVSYDDNSALLLELMRDVDDTDRGAAFETAAVWIDPRPGLDPEAAIDVRPPARARRLHNPYRRSVHLQDPVDEQALWDELSGHPAVLDQFVAQGACPATARGVDRDRVSRIFRALAASMRDAPGAESGFTMGPGEIRVPDTRIWTIPGRRADDRREPTHIAPSGLPADAPGRAVNAPHFLELSAFGKVPGRIGRVPMGVRGFGYDPVFRPEDGDRTLAEMGAAEKNALSHRGRALRRLFDAVRRLYLP